jgi:hypothetical protein
VFQILRRPACVPSEVAMICTAQIAKTDPQTKRVQSETEDPPIIYSSLNPHFSFQIFFEQLFSHLFFPFGLPFFIWKYGWTFTIAHGFRPTSIINCFGNWLFPTFLITILVTAQYLPNRIGSGYMVPTCIYLIHRFMISTKYGSLSHSEYAYVFSPL